MCGVCVCVWCVCGVCVWCVCVVCVCVMCVCVWCVCGVCVVYVCVVCVWRERVYVCGERECVCVRGCFHSSLLSPLFYSAVISVS